MVVNVLSATCVGVAVDNKVSVRGRGPHAVLVRATRRTDCLGDEYVHGIKHVLGRCSASHDLRLQKCQKSSFVEDRNFKLHCFCIFRTRGFSR